MGFDFDFDSEIKEENVFKSPFSARDGGAGAESAKRRDVLQIDGEWVGVEAEEGAHCLDALLDVLGLEAVERLEHQGLRLGRSLEVQKVFGGDFADRVAVLGRSAAVGRAGAAVEGDVRRRVHAAVIGAHVGEGSGLVVSVVDRRCWWRVVERIGANRAQRVDRVRGSGLRRQERVQLRDVLLHLVQTVLHDLVLSVGLERLLVLGRLLRRLQLEF